jgi:hypothetical protein
MLNDFSTEYSERSDDELLLLASDRASLTTEARAPAGKPVTKRFGNGRCHSRRQPLFHGNFFDSTLLCFTSRL